MIEIYRNKCFNRENLKSALTKSFTFATKPTV